MTTPSETYTSMFYKNYTNFTDKGPRDLLGGSSVVGGIFVKGVVGGRSVRDAETNDDDPSVKCHPFTVGEGEGTFYSPDYPTPTYPKNINCTRIIEGELMLCL